MTNAIASYYVEKGHRTASCDAPTYASGAHQNRCRCCLLQQPTGPRHVHPEVLLPTACRRLQPRSQSESKSHLTNPLHTLHSQAPTQLQCQIFSFKLTVNRATFWKRTGSCTCIATIRKVFAVTKLQTEDRQRSKSSFEKASLPPKLVLSAFAV